MELSSEGLKIPLISENFRPLELKLPKNKIIRTAFYFNEKPKLSSLVFISVSPSCGQFIRDELNNFDITCNLSPTSRDPKMSKIVLVFQLRDEAEKIQIQSLFNPRKNVISIDEMKQPAENKPYQSDENNNLFPASAYNQLEYEAAENLLYITTGFVIMDPKTWVEFDIQISFHWWWSCYDFLLVLNLLPNPNPNQNQWKEMLNCQRRFWFIHPTVVARSPSQITIFGVSTMENSSMTKSSISTCDTSTMNISVQINVQALTSLTRSSIQIWRNACPSMLSIFLKKNDGEKWKNLQEMSIFSIRISL